MTNKVTLDAIIPREDFDIKDEKKHTLSRVKDTVSINDLKKGEFFFYSLRKPDFQRETNEWDSKKICDFIQSFVEGDLIPAIILWKSASGYTFVIDGAHRISALAAWIHDDYGDGDISKQFYDGIISEDQIEIAQQTRLQVNKTVGSFKDYQLSLTYPDKVKPEITNRAKNLGSLAIQLQWVEGDSTKAEASFFKINQQASPLDNTEIRILKARKMPPGIAARAIVRSGKGHKYWSSFSEEIQRQIEEIAQEINTLLFKPELNNPIKTLDIPIGGKLYTSQSLPLVLDFINIVNDQDHARQNLLKKTENSSQNNLNIDADGSKTIQYLIRCRKFARIINSNHPSSLGLHPVVYFYSANGRHKIASFFAVTALINDFEKRNYYPNFIKVREKFENFVIRYDYLTQQIVRKYRSASASYLHIKEFYMSCIEGLLGNKSEDQILAEITKDSKFSYLTQFNDETEEITSPEFSREIKSATFIKSALVSALRCNICGGYIHKNSISIDHIKRKSDGGIGKLENAQLTHPYCNTGIKN